MYSNLGAQRYREADINSMTKEKMIVLLYEKIISDLEAARRAIVEQDRVEMTRKVNHSQRIVLELRNALDHSIGGEISRNLESLYDYLFHEHLEILIDQSPEHIDNCLTVLEPLLAAWQQIPAGTGEKAQREQVNNQMSPADGPDPASEMETTPHPAEPAPTTADADRDRSGLLSVSA